MNPTTHVPPVPHQPNEPIFFENITITHINGCVLPEPFQSHLKLHLFPGISFRIESESLPKQLMTQPNEGFHITTAGGFQTKVSLRFNLNDFMSPGDFFRGYLIPFELPCAVMGPDVEVQSVNFGVLNFRGFYGQNDKWITDEGNFRRLGSGEMHFGDFRMEITESSNFSESQKFLSRNDGYALTHAGFIERSDGATYLVKDVKNVLRATRAFLSFGRGSACGLTLVKATMPNGEDAFLEWGTTHAEPWICGSETWVLKTEGWDILSGLFPRFYELCCDPNWKDTILDVTDWYLNSNGSPFHIGIILAQAALEALSYKILGRKVRPMDNQIREALASVGISEKIPASCKELECWVNRVQGSSTEGHRDGPDAIVKIRNDLVHANKKYGSIRSGAQMDALHLSQWYIEMILLKKLGYVGRYRNRVSDSGRGSVESVP